MDLQFLAKVMPLLDFLPMLLHYSCKLIGLFMGIYVLDQNTVD